MRIKVLLVILVFAVGLQVIAFADSGSGSGSGSAVLETTPVDHAAPPVVVVVPADKLHDPLTQPTQAFDDIGAATKVGWPIAMLAVAILLTRTLGSLSKRWPQVKGLAWLNTGAAAVIVAAIATIATAAYNTLALGGTWTATVMAATVAGFALLAPVPNAGGKS